MNPFCLIQIHHIMHNSETTGFSDFRWIPKTVNTIAIVYFTI